MNEFEPIEKASHQHPLLYWKGYICVWMLMIPVQPDSLTLINSIPELSMTVEEWMCFLFPFIFVFERRYLIFCSDIVPSFQISALFSSIGLTFYIFQTNRFDAQTNGTIRWQLLLISDSVACIHRTQRYRDNTQYSLLTKYDFQKKKNDFTCRCRRVMDTSFSFAHRYRYNVKYCRRVFISSLDIHLFS